MSTAMLIEIYGYIGSCLVVVSMLMSSVVKLRVINTIGSIISGTYALIIGSFPLALMNGSLIVINIYNLFKLLKSEQHYEMTEGKADDSYLNYLLDHYKDDIKTYFPEFELGKTAFNAAYIVSNDAVPAGICLGKMTDETTMELVLDYTTPVYRDCSVGHYLYTKIAKCGVKKLTYTGKAEAHIAYLDKMGFVSENGIYTKQLS